MRPTGDGEGEGLLVGDNYFSEGVLDSLSDSGGGGLSDKIPVIR